LLIFIDNNEKTIQNSGIDQIEPEVNPMKKNGLVKKNNHK
jgi:hypothetical protein